LVPNGILPDQLGIDQQVWRNDQTQSIGGHAIDDQIELGRKLDRQVGRGRAPQSSP
jgi:hypothetical protein